MRRVLLLATLVALPLQTSIVEARDGRCPERLAIVGGSELAREVSTVMTRIYQQLGCQTKLVEMSGRRGAAAFQLGQVDGVVMRSTALERNLVKEFVRSGYPLFSVRLARWQNPDQEIFREKPTGFTMGVIWQDMWVRRQAESPDIVIIPFGSEDALLDAAEAGELGSFLSEIPAGGPGQSRLARLFDGATWENLGQIPLYHYLSPEFEEFMNRFSALLANERPFSHLEK